MIKVLKFIPWGKEYSLLQPIRSQIPQWWRNGESEFFVDGKSGGHGMKTCVPFMEIMTSGYVIRTPFDIYVAKGEDDEIQIRWQGPTGWDDFIGERPKELGSTIPRPAGHAPNGFVWACKWSWKTPRGYSTLVTHPFNRYDLPFTTLSGIIDSDTFHGNGNIPFFIKDDFTGIIPEGTPFAAVFPYKRNKWKMWVDSFFIDKIYKNQLEPLHSDSRKDFSYKKIFWKKKEY